MDALPSSCTIHEQCAVIRFLWAEGVKHIDIHRRMLAQYDSVNCRCQQKVYGWVKTFKYGRKSVSDEAPGSPW
jgi:hypothetical protein